MSERTHTIETASVAPVETVEPQEEEDPPAPSRSLTFSKPLTGGYGRLGGGPRRVAINILICRVMDVSTE